MLRKSSSGRSAPPEADKTAGSSRSWAAMRARLRQGREPIFGGPAGEPPPAAKPTPATNPLGHKATVPERTAKPAGPTSAPAQARPAAQQDAVPAVHEPTVSKEQRTYCARADEPLEPPADTI